MRRIIKLKYLLLLFLLSLIQFLGCQQIEKRNDSPNVTKPNVIIIMADDQGYGDLSLHGNPALKTPYLDRLGNESIRFTDFHVAPMCTPTRGQLLSGIDALRNGATAVCQGHSMIFDEVPLMPEYFQKSGYSTGIFGKWHLGDSYPHRPEDNGFEEVLSFPAWGITSLADRFGNSYFDPFLLHNGLEKEYTGYSNDIFFNEAIKWMKSRKDEGKPFFTYIPTNVPHVPEFVDHEYSFPYENKKYEDIDLPATFYGMIANIDQNLQKLDDFLDDEGLLQNTILIYLSDNGTQSEDAAKVFNHGMRGHKTSMYEGGHRVPLFIRWPKGGLSDGRNVNVLTQVQDILPTLIDLCELDSIKSTISLNGISLKELLSNSGIEKTSAFNRRKLVIQYSFGETTASKWDRSIVLWDKWRLIGDKELYNIKTDGAQNENVINQFPEIAKEMSVHYDNWYEEAKARYDKHRYIHIGNQKSTEVELYASDWDGGYCDNPYGLVSANTIGKWYVSIENAGLYELELRRWPDELDLPISSGLDTNWIKENTGKAWYDWYGELFHNGNDGQRPIAKAEMEIAGLKETKAVQESDTRVVFRVRLEPGNTALKTLFLDSDNKSLCSAMFVKVTKLTLD